MAKKLLPIFTLLFILIATPAVASNDKSQDHPQNHGVFVSQEAHEHEGGQAVSSVAKSDVGKKHDEDNDNDEDIDADDNVNPSATPTVSPTPNVSPSPDVSPSPSVSPSPDVSPSPSASPNVSPSPSVSPSPAANTTNENAIQNLIARLEKLISKLEHLFD